MSEERKVTRDTIIEAGMQLLPYVGGSLATLYFGQKQEKRFKRLESFYEEVREILTNLSMKGVCKLFCVSN